MTTQELLNMIDITVVKANGTLQEIDLSIELAKAFGLKSVIAHGQYVPYIKKNLENTDILTGTVAGFPLGSATTSSRVFQAKELIAQGADEIDTVMNISAFLSGNIDVVKKDLDSMAEACKDVVLKVIIETAYLNDEQTALASKLVSESGADFAKTSTGFWG